jgi:simple sugar transport system permease protein
MKTVTLLLFGAIQSGTSVLFGVYGETVCELVGVIYMGIEGSMILGAFTSYMVNAETGSPWLGLLAGMGAGMLLALLHAYFVISRKTNQIATGLTLMFLGMGITAFFGRSYISVHVDGFQAQALPLLSKVPILGPAIFSQDAITYLSYILGPLLWLLFFKTRLGIQLRGTGESERVIFAYGGKPILFRYLGVIAGGALAGIGGAQLSIAYTHTWIEGITNGRGIIAVALVILASWNPVKAYVGAYIFGGAQSLQLILQQRGVAVSPFLLLMLPYALTLAALFVMSRRKRQVMPEELKRIVSN